MSPAQSDIVSIAAAKLELMVLRVSLPTGDNAVHTVVFSDTALHPVTFDEAAQALAEMPKPLLCTASSGPVGILLLKCARINSRENDALHRALILTFGEHFAMPGTAVDDSARSILVRGLGEQLRCPVAAFARWYEDYLPPNSVAYGFGDDPAFNPQDGTVVDGIIDLYHVDPALPKDVPPELRFMNR